MPVCTQAVVLQFHLHASMEHSKPLPWVGRWTGGSLVVGSTEDVPKRPLIPVDIPIGDGLSMTASCMAFHQFTRCHMMLMVSVEDINQVWHLTQNFVAASIFTSTLHSSRAIAARSPLSGCFVERIASSHFTIGIITQLPPVDVKHGGGDDALSVTPDVADWLTTCYPTITPAKWAHVDMYADVPVCVGHRSAVVKVWMEVAPEHVRTFKPLPSIRVALHTTDTALQDTTQHHQHGPAACPYDSVKLFLVRPAENRLIGVTSMQLAATWEPSSRALCVFDRVMTAASGETLIGIECTVKEAYRPFVAPITHFIPPFLVVDAAA